MEKDCYLLIPGDDGDWRCPFNRIAKAALDGNTSPRVLRKAYTAAREASLNAIGCECEHICVCRLRYTKKARVAAGQAIFRLEILRLHR